MSNMNTPYLKGLELGQLTSEPLDRNAVNPNGWILPGASQS